VLCTTVGIDNSADALKAEVYPVPAIDVLNISFSETGQYELALYSVDGRLVYSSTYNGTKTQIAVDGLETGVYILSVNGENGNWTSKVLKN